MTQKELSQILTKYDGHSGSQLKYVLALSLFPEANKQELMMMTGLKDRYYAEVVSKVKEKDLPLLKFDNTSNLTSEPQDNAAEIEQLQARIAALQEQKQEVWMSLQKQVDRKEVLERENAELTQQLEQLQSNLEAAAVQIENLTKQDSSLSKEEVDAQFFQMMQTESELRNQIAQLTKERDDWKANAQVYKGAAEKYKKEQESAARTKNPLLYGFD